MRNYLVASILAVITFLFVMFAIPASAEELQADGTAAAENANVFTSEDGILSITLPNESWIEIQDPGKWIALSDGANLITLEHYSNGEKLPDITVADQHFVNTLMAAYSTQNEVFLATGFVTDPSVMNEINDSLLSIKVLKYDTKLAVNNNAAIASEFSVAPRDMIMYVSAGGGTLNVRSACSVDSYLLGELANGTAVHVTGVVQRSGADYGWYQIDFNNGTGYVASDYLVSNPPAQAPAPSNTQNNTDPAANVPSDDENETYLVYSQGSGRPVNITGSGGVFYDGFGGVYYAVGGGNFVDTMGAYYSTTMPASAPDTEVIGLVSDGSGRPVTIMENDDGTYTDEEGNEYYENFDGSYSDDYGATYQISGGNFDY